VNVGGQTFSQRHGIFHPLARAEPEILRVPSLRNVRDDPRPYFHDGSAATLDEAVRKMANAQLDLTLTDQQVDEIVAFLPQPSPETYRGPGLSESRGEIHPGPSVGPAVGPGPGNGDPVSCWSLWLLVARNAHGDGPSGTMRCERSTIGRWRGVSCIGNVLSARGPVCCATMTPWCAKVTALHGAVDRLREAGRRRRPRSPPASDPARKSHPTSKSSGQSYSRRANALLQNSLAYFGVCSARALSETPQSSSRLQQVSVTGELSRRPRFSI